VGGTHVHLASGMGSIHHYNRGHEVNLPLNKYWECRGNDGLGGRTNSIQVPHLQLSEDFHL